MAKGGDWYRIEPLRISFRLPDKLPYTLASVALAIGGGWFLSGAIGSLAGC